MPFIDDALFEFTVGLSCETFAPFIRDEVAKQKCMEMAHDYQERARQKERAAAAEATLRAEMGVEDDKRIG